MSEFVQRSLQPVSAARLFAWHESPGAFARLVPPFQNVVVRKQAGTIHDGDRLTMALKLGPLSLEWIALHQDYEAGRRFTDVQVKGPFARWSHTHSMLPVDDTHSVLEDRVLYRLPGRGLGDRLGGGQARRMLTRTFAWRHARTTLDLSRHAAGPATPLRIAITGAGGLVGTALVAFLQGGGHEVLRLVRGNATQPGTIAWDPSRLDSAIDRAALEGLDAVIHLAGENIAGGWWTRGRKASILDSRRIGTRVLAEALAGLTSPPKVFLSASATGYYGDGGDRVFDEHHRVAGTDFLAEVCQAWELASEPARRAGIRTVNMRLGVVLSPKGGALAKMLPAFKAGVGGPIGSGRQWLSWIGLDDALGAMLQLLTDETFSGPVNLVAPQPVTQAEFARTLGKVLRRPAVLPLPPAAIVALFGEMGQAVLLNGQRVVPTVLQEHGFAFATPWLEEALSWELGRVPPSLAARPEP